VRLKPTAVRIVARPTASETGQRGGTRHASDCRARLTQALANLSQGLQNLPIIAVGEKGQKISFELLFGLV